MARTQALIGGEIGINGHHYKGGQFLPSTQAEPGRWRVGGKWVVVGRKLIAPGEFAVQPTPFAVALFQLAGVGYATILDDHGRLILNPGANGDGVRDYDGNLITRDTEVRPGIKGILDKDATTIGAIVDAWNEGLRWFNVVPDAAAKTVFVVEVYRPIPTWLSLASDEDEPGTLAVTTDPEMAVRYTSRAEAGRAVKAAVRQHPSISFRLGVLSPLAA